MRVDRKKLAEARARAERERMREAQEPREGRGLLAQWLGLLLAPATFALHFQTSYLLVPWACLHDTRIWLHLVNLAGVAIALVGVAFAWRVWTRGGRGTPAAPGEAFGIPARERFLGATGLCFSGVTVLIMLAQWAEKAVVPCQ